MKLYATTENYKGKIVGIGSNEALKINIDKGNRRMVEFYITIEESDNGELFVIDMLNLSDGTTKRIFDHEFFNKGENQKGVKKCNDATCINCDSTMEGICDDCR